MKAELCNEGARPVAGYGGMEKKIETTHNSTGILGNKRCRMIRNSVVIATFFSIPLCLATFK